MSTIGVRDPQQSGGEVVFLNVVSDSVPLSDSVIFLLRALALT